MAHAIGAQFSLPINIFYKSQASPSSKLAIYGALLWAKILLVSFIAIYGYSVRDVVLVIRLMDSESFIEISTMDTSSKNYH